MNKKLKNLIWVSMACLPMILLSACVGGGGSSSTPSSSSTSTPTIVSVTPNDSSTGVDIDPTKIKLSLSFNEAMNATLPLTAVKIVSTTSSSQVIAITSVSYDAASKTYNITISTSSPLAYSTKYNIVVDPTQIKDANGNSMAATTPVTYSFTTENNPVVPPVTLPTIVSVTPNDGATAVDIDPTKIKLSLAFNEAMNATLPLTAVKLVSTTAGSQPIAITSASYDAASETYNMVISTALPLAYSTKYNIVVDPTQIKDANGNSMAATTTPITYSFTTENNPVVPPVTLPTIVSVTPNDNATGIDIDPAKIKLSLSFNEAMNQTLPLTAVKLVSTTAGSQSIAITSATYDASSETYNMVISTALPLAYSTKYNIVVDPTQIKDANGNSMTVTTPITYSFTTMTNPLFISLDSYVVVKPDGMETLHATLSKAPETKPVVVWITFKSVTGTFCTVAVGETMCVIKVPGNMFPSGNSTTDVTATANGYTSGYSTVRVDSKNEPVVSLPQTVYITKGQNTVVPARISEPLTTSVIVNLDVSSTALAKAGVCTIPAGQLMCNAVITGVGIGTGDILPSLTGKGISTYFWNSATLTVQSEPTISVSTPLYIEPHGHDGHGAHITATLSSVAVKPTDITFTSSNQNSIVADGDQCEVPAGQTSCQTFVIQTADHDDSGIAIITPHADGYIPANVADVIVEQSEPAFLVQAPLTFSKGVATTIRAIANWDVTSPTVVTFTALGSITQTAQCTIPANGGDCSVNLTGNAAGIATIWASIPGYILPAPFNVTVLP